ncbi:MAG: hypothetical protein AAFX09_09260 [Pseudomonadota bacterium]
MTASDRAASFQSLGYSGKDVHHVRVIVFPAIDVENGALVERHKIFIGALNGDYSTTMATDYIFMTGHLDWRFEEFTLGGRAWEGVAVFPLDGAVQTRFGDSDRKSVIMTNDCTKFYTHRYQMVMRNINTGELIATDPSTQSGNETPDLP